MTRRLALTLITLAVLTATGIGLARAANEPPRTPQEAAAAVEHTLRCPTCQGLSIADSPSAIAAGMRHIVEKQAAAGRSPDEIRAYFVARYGEWVLLSPPRHGLNWALWLLPGLTVATGCALAIRTTRRRPPTPHSGDAAALGDVDDAALRRARDTYADYRSGSFIPHASEEQVEASLELLTSIDEGGHGGQPFEAARVEAMRRLAHAVAAQQRPSEEPAGCADDADAGGQVDAPSEVDDEPSRDTERQSHPQPRPVRKRVRALAYAGGATAFAAGLGGLLFANTDSRGQGEAITGALTGPSSQQSSQPSTQASVDVDALRAKARNNPKDPAAWIALGLVLDRQGQVGQAYQAYRRALNVDPTSTLARRRAAWALIRDDKPAAAIPLLERAARRDPPNAGTVLLFGLAQYGADRPGAEATLRRYLELAPNGPASAQVRALLDQQEQQ